MNKKRPLPSHREGPFKMDTDTVTIPRVSIYPTCFLGPYDGIPARGPFRKTTPKSEDIRVTLCLSRNCGLSGKSSAVPTAVKNDGQALVLRQVVSDQGVLRRRNIDGGWNMTLPILFFCPCIDNQHLSGCLIRFFTCSAVRLDKLEFWPKQRLMPAAGQQ